MSHAPQVKSIDVVVENDGSRSRGADTEIHKARTTPSQDPSSVVARKPPSHRVLSCFLLTLSRRSQSVPFPYFLNLRVPLPIILPSTQRPTLQAQTWSAIHDAHSQIPGVSVQVSWSVPMISALQPKRPTPNNSGRRRSSSSSSSSLDAGTSRTSVTTSKQQVRDIGDDYGTELRAGAEQASEMERRGGGERERGRGGVEERDGDDGDDDDDEAPEGGAEEEGGSGPDSDSDSDSESGGAASGAFRRERKRGKAERDVQDMMEGGRVKGIVIGDDGVEGIVLGDPEDGVEGDDDDEEGEG